MLLAVTPELPPPSGPPHPAPVAELPHAAATEAQVPTPVTPYAVPPGPFGQPGPAGPFGQPGQPGVPPSSRGSVNGLAIAALCCGLAAFIPLVGVLAVVLGVVALHQLRSGFQRGRGRAITGIVLGALGTLGWAAVVVAAVLGGAMDQPQPSASAPVTGGSQVFVDKLAAGDCFSGGRTDSIDVVTRIPCTSPHESQVVTAIELPGGPYPGEAKVTDEAESGCSDKADSLLTDRAAADLDPSYIYPDADTWRGDRTVLCLVEAPSGTTTGSALK